MRQADPFRSGASRVPGICSSLYRVARRGWSPMRDRSALFIRPLLCGLLGNLCLILLPFAPRDDRAAGLLILYAIFGTAIAWELFQARQPRRLGLVELRSIRTD